MYATRIAGWRTWPVRLAALAALLFVPLWYRLPEQPAVFAPLYSTRFLLFIPIIITCALYFVLGFPGIRALAAYKPRSAWAFLLLGLAIWMYASAGWAFRREADPTLTIGTAIQFAVVALYAVAIASVRLPPAWAVAALICGLLWNAVLAGQQAALQEAAGGLWASLGEFPIAVTQPRISVVQADGIRWLRPYGLLPHPNMLAGFFVAALAAAGAWLSHPDWRRWLPGVIAATGGLWALLLTFSRGAFLSLAVASVILLLLFRVTGRWNRQLALGTVVSAVVGIAFAVSYYPYLLARAGVGAETTEQYSAGERAELNETALQVIGEAPITGVGAGNLPWRAAYILDTRDTDVQGNYPHNAWLTVWGELGIVGVVLLAGALFSATTSAAAIIRSKPTDAACRAALFAGFVGLFVTGMFEYYPVTLLQFQTLWWALAAVALAPADADVLDS
jgi:O-antigen ligase